MGDATPRMHFGHAVIITWLKTSETSRVDHWVDGVDNSLHL